MDEAQGTQSGTGLNARRGMKSESIDTINAILNNRDKNLTVILIFQDMAMGDSSLYGSVDSWLLIRKGIEERNGPQAVHHELKKSDYDWGNPQPVTPALEDLVWDALPEDDEDYSHMETMKQSAKSQGGADEDGEPAPMSAGDVPDNARNELIRGLDSEVPQKTLAEQFGLSQSRVSQIAKGDD
jgi:hypothetical protein